MTDADDDAFVDALRGRRAPGNLDTRRAARLARYFDDHPRAEHRVHHDPQGEAQLLAYLRAQPPVAAEPAAAPAAPGLLARLKGWLLPPQGLGLRHAGGALAMLGLAVVVFQLVPHGQDADDSHTMKGLPQTVQPAAPDAAADVQMLAAPDPQRAAQDLLAQLTAQGIAATVSQTGADWLLRANVPADRRAALASLLADQGLVLNKQGALAVQFQAPKP